MEQQTSPGQDLSQASYKLQRHTRHHFPPLCSGFSQVSRVPTPEPLRPGVPEEQGQAELCDAVGHLSE